MVTHGIVLLAKVNTDEQPQVCVCVYVELEGQIKAFIPLTPI